MPDLQNGELEAARKPLYTWFGTAGSLGDVARRALADGKQPYAVARRDGEPLAFAELPESWRSPERRDAAHGRQRAYGSSAQPRSGDP